MTDVRYGRVRAIFLAARELDADARRRYVEDACAGDAALRAEVERLMAHGEQAGAFLEDPALPGEVDLHALAAQAKTADAAPASLLPGESIDGYRLLRALGAGGFGLVFEAEQERPVRRRVALKVLREELGTAQARARFGAEREALARMEHPGIARVLDAGVTSAGRPYFALELIAGEPLSAWCARNGASLRTRLELIQQACAAVQHAHHKGIIHRDLKPSNVLVAEVDGRPQVKVIDFGIAKAVEEHLLGATLATRTGQLLGTPAYMSPEQAGSTRGDIDTRSDVYALGALLYELIAGHPPFDPERLARSTPVELQHILFDEEPPRPSTRAEGHLVSARSLPSDLDWIALRALEKDRERRYATAAELAADLERFLADEPVLARPPTAGYRLRKLARRHRAAFIGAAAVLAALVAGLAGTIWQALRASDQRDKAFAAQGEALAQTHVAQAEREEALRQKANAEEKAETVLAVLEFVQRMLTAAGPDVAQGRDPTVGQVLDATAREIAGSFAGPPAVEATFRGMLGNVYRKLGRLDDAAPHLEWAWRKREELAGPDDPDTLRSLNDWAAIVAERGDPTQAEQLYARSIESSRRVLGAEHLRTLTAMNNRAQALRELGRLDEAEDLLEEALDLRLRTCDERERFALVVQHNLAGIALQREDWDLAEPLLQSVLEARLEVCGPRHPETLETLSCLGATLTGLGRNAEAEAVLSEAVEGMTAVLGAESPLTVEAATRLAAARQAAVH